MVPLALFFSYAYPWKVYQHGHGRGTFAKLEEADKPELSYQGGPFGIYAWLSMLNPSDSLKAILFIFRREDRREPSGTSVAMTGYNSHDALVEHPYNAQSYSSPHTNQRE
jgi:hypothetical protein